MMTETRTKHATFTIERVYPASPARVFRAFSDPKAKARWFSGPPDWVDSGEKSFDFRVGGRERSGGGPVGGPVHRFDCLYYDIVPDRRIIYSYEMYLDTTRISVSLATIELLPEGSGTKLRMTEHGAFLDDHDDAAGREEGTRWLLGKLGESLVD